jgi:phage/plasmid-like protein (TIGR03299 family)
MSANIDMSNGRANIAFMGSRNDVWHRMGHEYQPGEDWAVVAGLDWEAIKVPAIAALIGPKFDHIDADKRFAPVPDRSFIVRGDTGSMLGYVSGEDDEDGYRIVQPRGVLDWFDRYIAVDDRFALDVAGSLDGGRRIWATATYNGDISVAGESHRARVLMSTTFDGTGSTINQCSMTRVVCENTIRVAHADRSAQIKTRHSTMFNAEKVGKELAQLAQGFAHYKAIGDALGRVEFAKDAVSDFFKDCLDIDRHLARKDVSTRKANQFVACSDAYNLSIREGAPRGSA